MIRFTLFRLISSLLVLIGIHLTHLIRIIHWHLITLIHHHLIGIVELILIWSIHHLLCILSCHRWVHHLHILIAIWIRKPWSYVIVILSTLSLLYFTWISMKIFIKFLIIHLRILLNGNLEICLTLKLIHIWLFNLLDLLRFFSNWLRLNDLLRLMWRCFHFRFLWLFR